MARIEEEFPQAEHIKLAESIELFEATTGGFRPSIRDLQRMADISSTSMVRFYLQRMEKENVIRRAPVAARSVMLLPGWREKMRTPESIPNAAG